MKSKQKWQELTLFYKSIFLLRVGLSAIVVTLCILGMTGVFDIKMTNNIVMPLMGIVILLSGIESYKKNKILAVFCFGTALFVFSTTIIVYSRYYF